MSNISVKIENKIRTEKMTILPGVSLSAFRGFVHQVLIVILINIPTLSFGLAFGWVSLVSGEDGEGEGEAVVVAVTTFTGCMIGVPLSAWAISIGRKFAIIATSFLFVLCWSLKLASPFLGVWSVVCARVLAGLGGSSAWALAPLLAREMCSDKYRGAAVTTLFLMHNVGILLMYLAADAALKQSTILWLCLGVSVIHCFISLFMPESPSFLAAQGKNGKARKSLAWLRGMSPGDPSLSTELATLPTPEPYERSPFGLAKAMLKDRRRRKAFIIGTIAVVGQEMCGILSIMQYAERVFILAGDVPVEKVPEALSDGISVIAPSESLVSPSRHAVVLGVVQLVFAAIALYLVERVGRRPLLVWCATLTGIALAASAVLVYFGSPTFAAVGLAAAVAADAAGLQPAPYSLLADMFDYEFRGCALMLATAFASAGNTFESAIFPGAVAVGGLTAALGLGAAMTLAYAIFAVLSVPETKDLTPEEIYQIISPAKDVETPQNACDKQTKCEEQITPVICVKIERNEMNSVIDKKSVDECYTRMGLLDKLSAWVGGGGVPATVLVLGLDNSGKTTLLRALKPPERDRPSPTTPTVPTVAQQQQNFTSGGVSFSAWDVSGAARMRALWERHYRRANAVIFVVDSADHLRLVVAREELALMLAHPDVSGRRLPLLVMANKSDSPHALSAPQVAAALSLERISDKPWHICACSALSGSGLPEGVAWLARQLREQLR
ncbi:probable metabolite transport protein CsbC [Aricia agestis]|uniref:probable metabolite transport protein CsbC n=1 Tax=Aricia agestis TaxID=91739 RepID=UPI001C20300B|nr:probable metabolite transport protein CsbC [Aricia agestis]